MQIQYIFLPSTIVFELNSINYKTTLHDKMSTLLKYGKGTSRYNQIEPKLLTYYNKTMGAWFKILKVKK